MTYRILIIDDNKPLADAIKNGIDWEAFHAQSVRVLYDALSVYDILQTEQIDLIISDIRMPGLSGLEMARHILSENYDTKIILISAYEDFQYVQEAIRIGAVDYIEKPVNFDYLQSIVIKALQQIEEKRQIKKQARHERKTVPVSVMAHPFGNPLPVPGLSRFSFHEYGKQLSFVPHSEDHQCGPIPERGRTRSLSDGHYGFSEPDSERFFFVYALLFAAKRKLSDFIFRPDR